MTSLASPLFLQNQETLFSKQLILICPAVLPFAKSFRKIFPFRSRVCFSSTLMRRLFYVCLFARLLCDAFALYSYYFVISTEYRIL